MNTPRAPAIHHPATRTIKDQQHWGPGMPCVILTAMTRPSKVPKPLQPMLATLIDEPFDNPSWVFETKWDGFRLVARIEDRHVTLFSRSGLIVSHNYMP